MLASGCGWHYEGAEMMQSAVRYRELSRDRKGGVKIEVLCPECYVWTPTWLWSFFGGGKKCRQCQKVLTKFGVRK